jgi:hypothetical protein
MEKKDERMGLKKTKRDRCLKQEIRRRRTDATGPFAVPNTDYLRLFFASYHFVRWGQSAF